MLSIQKAKQTEPWDLIVKRFATFVNFKCCNFLCNSIKSIHVTHIASITIQIVFNEQQWHGKFPPGKTGRRLVWGGPADGQLGRCKTKLENQMQDTTMVMFADRNFNKRLKRAHQMSMMMKGSRRTVLGSLSYQGQSTKSGSSQQHSDFLMRVYFDCYGRTLQELQTRRLVLLRMRSISANSDMETATCFCCVHFKWL